MIERLMKTSVSGLCVALGLLMAPAAASAYPRTPEGLHAAVVKGDLGAVQDLVSAGISPDRPSKPELDFLPPSYPIESAAAECRPEIMKYLLSHGAKANPPRAPDTLTPLMLAAMKGCTEGVNLLLGAGAAVNAKTTHGDTALIQAAYQGHLAVAQSLVKAGASLTAKNKDGDTPYRAAVWAKNHDVASYLGSVSGKGFKAIPAVAEPTGATRCVTEYRAGLEKKIITVAASGKTYAINGQARDLAEKRGWIDGFTVFNPEQMQRLLKEGLARC